MNCFQERVRWVALAAIMLMVSGVTLGQETVAGSLPAAAPAGATSAPAKIRLVFNDGTSVRADEAWESEHGVWYRQSGMSHLVSRDRIKAIEPNGNSETVPGIQTAKTVRTAGDVNSTETTRDHPVWIHLVGGARIEADSATDSLEGVWYRRGSLTIFVERSRVDHVQREADNLAETDSPDKKERGWTTGNSRLDALIRQNGMKYGVDPYLIFCVMQQESHFNARALSPKGARGLMQLMPGTAARFGVTRPGDPAQNIAGGTRYLKQLIAQFDGRVDLVLASYNAGEGAVLKFGRKVPPYRETRDYVKKISYRYRRNKSTVFSKGELTSPAARTGT